jgi:hypothetical protein
VRIKRARRKKAAGRLPERIEQMMGKGDGRLTTDEIMALTRGEMSGIVGRNARADCA